MIYSFLNDLTSILVARRGIDIEPLFGGFKTVSWVRYP